MSRGRLMAIGGAALTLALAAGTVAIAEDAPDRSEKKAERQKYESLYIDRLAARLGIDREKLLSARKAAAEDIIAQALKDGVITEEQAKRLRAHLAETDGFGLGFGFGRFGKHEKHGRHGALGRAHRATIEAVAGALKMSATQLKEAMRSGKSIEDLAKAAGTTIVRLQTVAVDAVRPVLKEMVSRGVITQERADRMIEKIRAWVASLGRHDAAERPAA